VCSSADRRHFYGRWLESNLGATLG
jgi:hypothetical protein